jgi:hypothetical protein
MNIYSLISQCCNSNNYFQYCQNGFTANRQEDIQAIASFALGLLATLSLIHVCCFKKDSLNGRGKKVFSNGTIHEGDFLHDVLHGKGEKQFHNGERHIGQFKNGLLDGEGEKHYSNGTIERGVFEEGWLKQGEVIYLDGRIVKVDKEVERN